MNTPWLFLSVWLATWNLCWWSLARLVPVRWTRTLTETTTDLTTEPGAGQIGGRTYSPGEWRITLGGKGLAPYLATIAAFAVDWIVT